MHWFLHIGTFLILVLVPKLETKLPPKKSQKQAAPAAAEASSAVEEKVIPVLPPSNDGLGIDSDDLHKQQNSRLTEENHNRESEEDQESKKQQ